MPTPLHRPRILIITRNLPPLVGGMERLNWHMAGELSNRAAVRVVGPAGAAAIAPAGVPVLEVPLQPLWKFLLQARALARREARTWEPNVILAGSGIAAPLARAAARMCSATTAAYVHGLDVAVKHPVYRAIWLPALRRMDRVIANSHATAALCRSAGIDTTRIGIVHPGVDLPEDIPLTPPSQAKGEAEPSLFGTKGGAQRRERSAAPQARGDELYRSVDLPVFRTRHALANRPLLLSVGRLSARKGLREFVSHALPQIAAEYPDVMLLVVGDVPANALHAQAQTPASIQAAATRVGMANSLRFLGTITDYDELGEVYRAANVHVFPVRDLPGDPEGFGMVAVEAAAHGLPTVAFATGGIVDAVAEGQSGHLVPAGDYSAFAAAVSRVLATRGAMRTASTIFARNFAWPEFGARVFHELTDV